MYLTVYISTYNLDCFSKFYYLQVQARLFTSYKFMFMFNLDFCFLTFVKWLFASSIQICVLPVYKYNIDFAIWQLTSISIKLLYFDCLQEQPRICGKQNSIWNDKISTNLWWLLLISCRLSWGLSSNDRISTNLWWLLLISCRLWWGPVL